MKPRNAFFNSSYSEYGMSFSPDGETIYFSSTRPRFEGDTMLVWRIWYTEKLGDGWSKATWMDFPNLEKPLQSHPSIDVGGNLFFHASNIDYSDMNLYHVHLLEGAPRVASLVGTDAVNKCTPYISVEGNLLFYAIVSDPIKLAYRKRRRNKTWSDPIMIGSIKNLRHQGNPFLTTDGRFLFFATEQDMDPGAWNIHWMPFTEAN